MFTKGGMHKINLDGDNFCTENIENYEIEITVQMQRDDQGRFDFINSEAEKHKQRVKDET